MHKCIWSTSPVVFAWRRSAAIFANCLTNPKRKTSENRKFPGVKKPTIGFLTQGGESNAQEHLVLTSVVFALRLNTAIFACFAGKNRKFRSSKKPNVGFFERGLS